MEIYWKQYIEYIKGRGNIDEVMIISSEDGSLWASSEPDNFILKQYKANIMQEDGTEKEELVNEATNILKFMKGEKPSQGLRINGQKKHQVTRTFKDEQTGLQVIFSKIPNGGACIANAGKCTLIGTFNETKNHSSPDCNETIQLMAMYLNKSTWPDKDELPGTSGGAQIDFTNINWQTHIEKSLVGRGNIAEAMLVSVDNMEVLASTTDFKVLKPKLIITVSAKYLYSYIHIKRKSLKKTEPIGQRPWTKQRI
jgi:hypothetical protein